MCAMDFLLNDKVESALVALVRAAVADTAVSVLPGKDAGTIALPCVICAADGDGLEDPIGTGNCWVNATVAIKHAAADEMDEVEAKTYMQELVAQVFGAVQVGDLAEKLTAAIEDFTVFPGSVVFGAAESGRDEAGVWVDSLPVRLYCCGQTLT